MNTKTVYVLLTQYKGIFPGLLRICNRFSTYNHASMTTETHGNAFFSFVTKDGFYVEHPLCSKQEKKNRQLCALYAIHVPQEHCSAIDQKIAAFRCSNQKYRYSFLGLWSCLLGIKLKRTHAYFCSQFVSEVLQLCPFIRLPKPPELCMPDDLCNVDAMQLVYTGTIGELAQTFPIATRKEWKLAC